MRTSTKRALLVLVALAAATAGAMTGPELYGYYRFEQALDQMVKDGSRDGIWPALRETCFACHGPQGQSHNRQYPALSGQPASYIESQLRAFAAEERRHPTMGPLALSLSDASIHDIARFYAAQKPGRNEIPADMAQWDQGRTVVASSGCQGCHDATQRGPAPIPRIAGQGETYLERQLRAFKSGERRDPTGTMNAMAGAIPDALIPSVALYLASVNPATSR